MTVQELRNTGYKVRVLHNRLYNGYHKWQVGTQAGRLWPQSELPF